jgi:site-specific recombinase XerD
MVADEWPDIAESFKLFLVTHGYANQSITSYISYTVIVWRWFHFRDRPLSDVTARELANFIVSAKKSHTANTIRNFTSALRVFFKFCVVEGLREDDPTKGMSVRKPKLQPRQPFSFAELKAMHAAITDPRDLVMFYLMLSTGIRIGEVVAIRVQDIDWQRGLILVHGKGSKERWVPVTESAAEALSALVAGRRIGPLLLTQEGTPMSRERARKRLVLVGERAGVVHVYPHRWRITTANDFLEAGGDMGALQSLLGHEDITTTNHYAGYSRASRGIEQARKFDLGKKLA